jgi:CO/xanthine dehydrogenase Mo-binding subunit
MIRTKQKSEATTAESQARQFRVIGKRVPKVGGVEMVTGLAQYGADVYLPGMLTGKILRSPYAHARIKRIDTRKAEKLKGVHAVVTGADFPPVDPVAAFPIGEIQIPLRGIAALIIAKEKALFHGHPVAAVAAAEPWIADEAMSLIKVEYEELEPVVDIEQAMREDAPIVLEGFSGLEEDLTTKDAMGVAISKEHSNVAQIFEMGWGDVEKGFAEADVVVERTYYAAMAHQGYIEPNAAVARWEPDGKVTLWTCTQGSFAMQLQIAGLLNLPLNKVRVIPTELGGGFGGKALAMHEPVAILLSKKSGRPVRIVMTREEVLRATGPGSPVIVRFKTGCKNDGTLTAVEADLKYDAGCIPGSAVGAACQTFIAPYKTPHLKIMGYDVVTNKTRVQSYRAPGAPQATFGMEQNVEEMAQRLGMDALAFRQKNATQEGDLQASGVPFNRIGLKEMLERMVNSDHYKSPLPKPQHDGKVGRGTAVGFWFGAQFTSTATVQLNSDGTVSMVVGSVDMSGTRTAIVQVCAEELGIEPEQVFITVGDTETAGYTDVTGGSRITYTMSHAVYNACKDAVMQLMQRAAKRFGVKESEIEWSAPYFIQKVEGRRQKAGKRMHWQELVDVADDAVVGRGSTSKLKPAPAFSGHIADVEVDPDTGKVHVLRYTTFQDVGRCINPDRVEAQMQGGAVQGIGWALTEEYVFNDKGIMLNPSLLDYKQLTALDVPLIDCEIIEVPASDGPYGIRGVGEAPIIPPPGAIANAVADALDMRLDTMPMTPERVLKAVRMAWE